MTVRKTLWLVLFGASALLISGCKDQAPPPPTVNGTWVGNSGGINISLTMSQSGSNVTGTGQMNGPDDAIALGISGTFVETTLSATLTASGYEPVNFTGHMNSARTQLVGSLNGSGFQGDQLTLTKR